MRYTTSKASDIVLPLSQAAIDREQQQLQNSKDAATATSAPSLDVSFEECMATYADTQSVEGFNCSKCLTKTTSDVCTGLSTLPETLVVQVKRFGLFNSQSWVPTKLMTNITFNGCGGHGNGQMMTDTDAAVAAGATRASGLVDCEGFVPPVIDLAAYIQSGIKDGEELLPESNDCAANSKQAGGLAAKMAAVSADTVEMICGFTGTFSSSLRYYF